MKAKKIEWIEKGWGEESRFYTTNPSCRNPSMFVEEIIQGEKKISDNLNIVVFRGYKNNELFFEMGFNSDVTIQYYPL